MIIMMMMIQWQRFGVWEHGVQMSIRKCTNPGERVSLDCGGHLVTTDLVVVVCFISHCTLSCDGILVDLFIQSLVLP